MPTGSVLGLTAKLGVETDDRQVERETRSLKEKLSDAAEAEMSADIDTLKGDISEAIESATEDADWVPDGLGTAISGAIGGSGRAGSKFSDEEKGRLTQRMEALGNVSGGIDSLGGGGGGGGGAAAGAVAGDMFSGMKGAGGKFLKVGLAGAVGLGILSKVASLADAAPRMQKVMSMQQRAIGLFARPFYDFLAKFLEGGAENLLKMAANFNQIYAEEGLAVAVASLPRLFFTRGGDASKAGTAGRVAGGLAGAAGGAYAGAKIGGGLGALLGSVIPGAGTAAGGTAGAVLGGAAGGLAGLVGGAGLGEWAAEELKDATGDFVEGLRSMEPSTWGDKLANAAEDFGSYLGSGAEDLAEKIREGGSNLAESIREGSSNFAEQIRNLTLQDLWRGSIQLGKWILEGNIRLGRWFLSGSIGLGKWLLSGTVGLGKWLWSGSVPWGEWVFSGSVKWGRWMFSGAVNWGRWIFSGAIGLGEWLFNGSVDIAGFITGSIDVGKYVGGNGGGDSGLWPGAAGGVVTRPTSALIGEGAESEAVVPLSQLGSMLDAEREQGRRESRPRGTSGRSDEGLQRVVDAIEDLHTEIKRLDPQTELTMDGKTLAKEEQKSSSRYRESRVVSK